MNQEFLLFKTLHQSRQDRTTPFPLNYSSNDYKSGWNELLFPIEVVLCEPLPWVRKKKVWICTYQLVKTSGI